MVTSLVGAGTITTNVPVPVFGAGGFILPLESAVLAGVQADINAAFGGNLNFTTQSGGLTNPTPQGQLANSLSAIIGNANDTFLFYTTQTDPAFAEGRMQDAIGRIYFIERLPSTPTTLNCTILGAPNVNVPANALVVDPSGNLYQLQNPITIPLGGSIGGVFSALSFGTLSVPSSVAIYQAIPGWDSVIILNGIQGSAVETRNQFEARRALSTAQNSGGQLPSILGAVLTTPGVKNCLVLDNPNGFLLAEGGTILAPNSVYVAAFAPNAIPLNIATAIWSRKAPGANYNGNTTVTVQDTSPGYVPPFPSYQVSYETPSLLPVLFNVQIVNSNLVPANAISLIQGAIIGAANNELLSPTQAALSLQFPGAVTGTSGSVPFNVGTKIWASNFVPPIAALGSWAQGQIISVQIGSMNDSDSALFFGSCGGSVLNVTSIVTGTLAIGQTITDGTGIIVPGTVITAFITGTGAGGTYQISQPNTTGTILMGTGSPNKSFVQPNITQMPSISAANIVVGFQ